MHGIGAGSGWERLFWLLFHKTTTPIAVLDENRRVVEANEAVLDLFGRSRGDLIGTSIVDVIEPSERAEHTATWEQFLRSGEMFPRSDDLDIKRTFVRPDHTKINLQLAARWARIGERRLAVFVVIPQAYSWSVPPAQEPPGAQLTARERQIVGLIALGRETTKIAQELHISPETVRTHVRNAMGKLEVHTRAQLVAVVVCNESLLDLLRLEY
ncbi:MAG: LuxR C-terminal-related transcriptional regulator [Actinomycetota bacterium]|nr:LuxR C-terminal-related transcriptional regulator [Actinomycetota bacterium]